MFPADGYEPSLEIAATKPAPFYIPHDQRFCASNPSWGGDCTAVSQLGGKYTSNLPLLWLTDPLSQIACGGSSELQLPEQGGLNAA